MSTYAYVANSNDNNVSVIDLTTNTEVTTILVGSDPINLAITQDGNYAYVVNYGTRDVSVIDTNTNTVVDTIFLSNDVFPIDIAVTPNGDYIYVSTIVGGSVFAIDTSTNTAVDNIPVGSNLEGITITPDGSFAYVADSTESKVAVISTVSNTVITTIYTELTPAYDVVVSPDGNFAYITAGNIMVAETSTNTIVDSIATDPSALNIAITPDGRFLYVTDFFINQVSVIDTNSRSLVATVSVGTEPWGVAITSDGNFAYVTNSDDTVSVIDTGTNTVVDTINVGAIPRGIAMLNIPEPQIDLTITKADSPDPVMVGESLNYTIIVSNNGPATATDVTLIDTLPEDVDFISATPTKGACSESGGIVTCNLTTIENGESVTTTISVVPKSAGNICNNAEVSANEFDSNPSDNTVIECTTVFEPVTPQELISDLISYVNGLNILVRLILVPLLLNARFLINIGLDNAAVLILNVIILLVRVLMFIRLLSDIESQEIISQIEAIKSLL